MALNVLFSFGFAAWFTAIGWMPHGGLALANSLATALEMSALLIMMRRRLHGLDGSRLGGAALQAALGTLAMGVFLGLWLRSEAPAWQIALAGIPGGGAIYLLALWALRVPELHLVLGALRRRLARAVPGAGR